MQGRYRSKFLKRASLRSSRALSLPLPLLPSFPSSPTPTLSLAPSSPFHLCRITHSISLLPISTSLLLSPIYWILDFLTFSAYPFCPSFPFISFPFPFFTPSLSSSYYPSLPSLPLSFPPPPLSSLISFNVHNAGTWIWKVELREWFLLLQNLVNFSTFKRPF